MTQQALAEHLVSEEGYKAARVLPDGSVAAILDLMFTRAIVLDCTATGYGNRFCFENKALADQRFLELRSDEDVPEGFIARR